MHRFLSLIVRSRWKEHNFQWNKFIEFDSILTWDSFWYKIQISSDAMGNAWNYQMITWIRANLDTFFLLLSFFLLPNGVHVIKYMIYNIPPPPHFVKTFSKDTSYENNFITKKPINLPLCQNIFQDKSYISNVFAKNY